MNRTNPKLQNWKVLEGTTFPDFIIGGAMKSGTTTMHRMLVQHPDVWLLEIEIGFCDIDNIFEHPNFNFYDKHGDRWVSQQISDSPEKF